MQYVSTEVVDECTRIRLSNGPTNLLNTEVLAELAAVFEQAERNSCAVLLCGGDKFFSNGVDLDWALGQSTEGMRSLFLELGYLMLRLLESPLPVVGVIKGHAMGGAKALFLACDYRYSATGRVLIGAPEVRIGVPNPYYSDQLVRFVAGDFVGSDLIYTGKLVTGEEGVSLGLVHEVAPPEDVEQRAWERVLLLRDLPAEAFAESKRMRIGAFCADVRAQMSSRVARQVEIWNSKEAQQLLRAAATRLAR